MPDIRLNPTLDPAPFARIYAQKKCVQITPLFEDDVADALAKAVASLPWRLVCQNDAGQNLLLTAEQVKQMPPAEKQALDAGIRQRAANNLGFTYLTYPMVHAVLENWDPGHPIHLLTQFLNSRELIDFAGAVIGHKSLTKTDAHATNYQRGHYLTRHIDDGERKERRAAYTLGFSREWQPDWGGLLLFLTPDGDVISGLRPRFNTLTIFDGLQLHAVSSVSNFVTAQRLSIAGWFRDDPPGM